MKVSFRSCPSLAPSWLAGWSLYVQSCFIRGVKVQINFCHMVENCFVVVRLASSCFVFWIQNILATLRIVLQLGQNYSCRWVESNFVAGFIFSHEIGLNASRDWKIGEYGWAIFANFQISRIAKLYNIMTAVSRKVVSQKGKSLRDNVRSPWVMGSWQCRKLLLWVMVVFTVIEPQDVSAWWKETNTRIRCFSFLVAKSL